METIKELRKRSKTLEPVVRIGKSGLTPPVVGEIKKHLKAKGMIKIKMLKSFAVSGDKKSLADEIAQKTGSVLIQRTGFVAVIARKSIVDE